MLGFNQSRVAMDELTGIRFHLTKHDFHVLQNTFYLRLETLQLCGYKYPQGYEHL